MLGNFITQLRRRFGRRRVVLEGELLESQDRIAKAEDHAEQLKHTLEANLVEEQTLRMSLAEELKQVKCSYDELSDALEAETIESSQKLKASSEKLSEVCAQLEAAEQKEAALLARLDALEQDEARLAEEQNRLVQEFTEATRRESILETRLTQKEAIASTVANELAAERSVNDELKAEMERRGLQETKYKQWIKDAEAENLNLRQRLVAVKELELREEKLAAKISEAHAENKKLDEALQLAEQSLRKQLLNQRTAA